MSSNPQEWGSFSDLLQEERQKKGSLSTVDSLPTEQPPAPPVDRQANMDRPASMDSLSTADSPDLLKNVPEVAGRTGIPHRYTDHLCRWLTPDEQAIYLQLYRLSWGWHKDTCFISNPKLSERSNVPLTSMRRAISKLMSKGLITKTNRVFGSDKEQGIEYRVFNLDSLSEQSRLSNMDRVSKVAPNKEMDLKESNKREPQLCPKCKDTGGFYYPKGIGTSGVVKCKHD